MQNPSPSLRPGNSNSSTTTTSRNQRRIPAPRPPRLLARTARNPDPGNRRMRRLVRIERNSIPALPALELAIHSTLPSIFALHLHLHPQPPKPPHDAILPRSRPSPTLPASTSRRLRRNVLQLPLLPGRHDQITYADRSRKLDSSPGQVLGRGEGDLEGVWGEGVVSRVRDHGCEERAQLGVDFCRF
jgi:hypothetical protein